MSHNDFPRWEDEREMGTKCAERGEDGAKRRDRLGYGAPTESDCARGCTHHSEHDAGYLPPRLALRSPTLGPSYAEVKKKKR